MTIEKFLNGKTLEIKLIGHLDTATAPELEAALSSDALAELTLLVLDLEELEYVSSAGLRVILNTQKEMSKRGRMKLTHVNETIMEVFDITAI